MIFYKVQTKRIIHARAWQAGNLCKRLSFSSDSPLGVSSHPHDWEESVGEGRPLALRSGSHLPPFVCVLGFDVAGVGPGASPWRLESRWILVGVGLGRVVCPLQPQGTSAPGGGTALPPLCLRPLLTQPVCTSIALPGYILSLALKGLMSQC